MRPPFLALSFALLLPAIALPDEATDLRDKALAAAAKDPADLKKFRVHTLKCKAVSHLIAGLEGTFELAAEWPGKLRATWDMGSGPTRNAVTDCCLDDQGWRQGTNIPLSDLSLEDLNDMRANTYAVFAATLLTISDAETKLAPAGRSKVGGDAVVGLKLSRRPWPDITLYFDEKTYLLRKMTYRARDSGIVVTKEMIFSDHADVAGIKLPTRQTALVQGKEIYTWKDMEYAFPDKIDPKTFEKP